VPPGQLQPLRLCAGAGWRIPDHDTVVCAWRPGATEPLVAAAIPGAHGAGSCLVGADDLRDTASGVTRHADAGLSAVSIHQQSDRSGTRHAVDRPLVGPLRHQIWQRITALCDSVGHGILSDQRRIVFAGCAPPRTRVAEITRNNGSGTYVGVAEL